MPWKTLQEFRRYAWKLNKDMAKSHDHKEGQYLKGVTRDNGRLKSERRANDLDGKTWINYSISVWNELRKGSGELKFRHPASFPENLARRLIESFSRPGDLVFDPFLGTGTTLKVARDLGRPAVGMEIYEHFLAVAGQRMGCGIAPDSHCVDGAMAKIIKASAMELLDHIGLGTVTLTVTSPPYWDILNQKRTADGKEIRHYGEKDLDLGNISDYQAFLHALARVFELVYKVTCPGGRLCVVVMDLRKKDRFYPLHMDLASLLVARGWTLDDIIIWDRRHEYNNLRPLGYPYVFRINRVHEYILIFQRR